MRDRWTCRRRRHRKWENGCDHRGSQNCWMGLTTMIGTLQTSTLSLRPSLTMALRIPKLELYLYLGKEIRRKGSKRERGVLFVQGLHKNERYTKREAERARQRCRSRWGKLRGQRKREGFLRRKVSILTRENKKWYWEENLGTINSKKERHD